MNSSACSLTVDVRLEQRVGELRLELAPDAHPVRLPRLPARHLLSIVLVVLDREHDHTVDALVAGRTLVVLPGQAAAAVHHVLAGQDLHVGPSQRAYLAAFLRRRSCGHCHAAHGTQSLVSPKCPSSKQLSTQAAAAAPATTTGKAMPARVMASIAAAIAASASEAEAIAGQRDGGQ